MIYYKDDLVTIYHGDCRAILPSIQDVSAVLTDPPYELGFMGKSWDSKGVSFLPETWRLILEACLPGAMLLSFGGTRTSHRLACAIEDAGWQIRDTIMWVYSTGFPKSLNISKQLQKKSLCGIIEVDEEINHNTTGIESKTSGAKGEKQTPKYCLRLMPKADLQKGVYTKEERGEVLQPGLSQQDISQSRQSSDYDGEGQSSVEGWCNIQASQRELQRCQICQMSERIPDNGEERWLCYGTPLGYGTAYWSPTPQDRSCPSYRPQPSEQPNRQSNTIPHKQSSQELRGAIVWEGYGTGLKPSYEPILVCMNPLDGTFANNALKHRVAGLNIDECRIEYQSSHDYDEYVKKRHSFDSQIGKIQTRDNTNIPLMSSPYANRIQTKGRFPANFILDGSQEVMELFPDSRSAGKYNDTNRVYTDTAIFNSKLKVPPSNRYAGDKGSAARFFYCAKSSRRERDAGLEGFYSLKENTPLEAISEIEKALETS